MVPYKGNQFIKEFIILAILFMRIFNSEGGEVKRDFSKQNDEEENLDIKSDDVTLEVPYNNFTAIAETFKDVIYKLNTEDLYSKANQFDKKYSSENKISIEADAAETLLTLQNYLSIFENKMTDKRYYFPDGNKNLHVEKFKIAKMLLKVPSDDSRLEGYCLLLEAALEGNLNAKGELAWAFLFGVHLPLKVEFATILFRELTEVGDPTGHTGLAILHSIGLVVPYDPRRALVHFTVAAMGGSIWAKMALGYRYWSGVGVRINCKTALEFYITVAEHVVAEYEQTGESGIIRLPLLENAEEGFQSGTDIDMINYLELLAVKGDVTSQIKLGKIHYIGDLGLPRDLRKALHYFKLAAEYDIPEANAFVGTILLDGGDGISPDLSKAYIYLKKSADQEHPIGEAGLGKMYLEGKYVSTDYHSAIYYLTRSANRGWSEAMIQLGKMCYFGLGMDRNISLAKQYFVAAGRSGHILSFYYLGQMFANGIGVMRSCVTAVELMKVVSERGIWRNLFTDALTLFNTGKADEPFVISAVLAELGYMFAQSNVAYILDEKSSALNLNLEYGHEDIQQNNHKKALQYWSRAAIQGYHEAILKIGDHYYYGLGTDVDYETAAEYYAYAVYQHKNPQAMYNLGFMYEHGKGLEKSTIMARKYYDMTIESSDDACIVAAIALTKLTLIELCDSIVPLTKITLHQIDHGIGKQWDLCIGTVLIVVLSWLISKRRRNRELHFQNEYL